MPNIPASPSHSPFPKNFLWGAATSAHQVEGNNHNDWTEWEKLGLVKNTEQSGRATGHYERFKQDFALAKELGHNAHRFSIEWSRIEPKPGVYDPDAINHYRQALEELRRLGLEPVVTLHHFTNPLWTYKYGAWGNRRMADDFARYVLTVVKELGSLVNYWVTINEPTVNISLSYLSDIWPPQRNNPVYAWTALHHMLQAHRLAYHIIHRHFPNAKVGVANNIVAFEPSRRGNPADRALASLAHYWYNQWWMDRTFQTQDYIGLNYYFRHPLRSKLTFSLRRLMEPTPEPGSLQSDLGWEIYPIGLAKVLRWLKQYDRPIIITENGLADAADKHRAQFIRDHVAVLASALSHGVDVRGYLYWSLIDNFEWREGFTPRFGLVEVDYHSLVRKIRPSAYTYRQICQQNGLG